MEPVERQPTLALPCATEATTADCADLLEKTRLNKPKHDKDRLVRKRPGRTLTMSHQGCPGTLTSRHIDFGAHHLAL